MSLTTQDRYVREVLRPLAERIQRLDLAVEAAVTGWAVASIDNDSATHDDRETDGIEAIAGTECHELKDLLLSIRTALAAERELVEKFTVRQPFIS